MYIKNNNLGIMPLNDSEYALFVPLTNKFINLNSRSLHVLSYFDTPIAISTVMNIIRSTSHEVDDKELSDLMNLMSKSGVIVPVKQATVYSAHSSGAPILPESISHITVHVTKRCNLQCTYCYSNKYRSDLENKELDYASWEKIINDAISLGIKSLHVTGGEPTLRTDLFPLWKLAKDSGIYVQIITNATFLDEVMASKLKECSSMVVVSIDSDDETLNDAQRGHGTYKKIQSAIKNLNTIKANWYAQMVITRDSVSTLEQTVKKYKELSGREVITSLLTGTHDYDAEIYDIITRLYSSKYLNTAPECGLTQGGYCGAARSMIAIDWTGHIYPCKGFVVSEYEGNSVLEDGILNARDNSYALMAYRAITIGDIDKCNSCPYSLLCFGGCRAAAMMRTGSATGFIGDAYCYKFKRKLRDKVKHATNK